MENGEDALLEQESAQASVQSLSPQKNGERKLNEVGPPTLTAKRREVDAGSIQTDAKHIGQHMEAEHTNPLVTDSGTLANSGSGNEAPKHDAQEFMETSRKHQLKSSSEFEVGKQVSVQIPGEPSPKIGTIRKIQRKKRKLMIDYEGSDDGSSWETCDRCTLVAYNNNCQRDDVSPASPNEIENNHLDPNAKPDVIHRLVAMRASAAPQRLRRDLLSLTKHNMREMYDSAQGWANWDDAVKEDEIFNTKNMELVLAFGRKSTASEPGVESDCSVVLQDLVGAIGLAGDFPLLFRATSAENEGIDFGLSLHEALQFCADEQQVLLGYVAIRTLTEIPFGKDAWNVLYIHEIQVSHSNRGCGIGKSLLNIVERRARAQLTSVVMLTVLSTNEGAKAFYLKRDYSVDETCPSFCYQIESVSYRIFSKVLFANVFGTKCALCSKSFRFPNSAKIHACLEHGVPWSFLCHVPGCGKGCTSRDDFRVHLDSHTARNPETHLVMSQRIREKQEKKQLAVLPDSVETAVAYAAPLQHNKKQLPHQR